jgi:PAS domain S-box-containing protein
MVTDETTQLLQALDGNLTLFELLLDNSRDIMTLHKPDSTYLYTSRIIEKVTGFTQKEMVGQTLYDVSLPEFKDQMRAYNHWVNLGKVF